MKRIKNLFERIVDIENLRLADEKARKGKLRSFGVKKWDLNRVENLMKLHEQLVSLSYKTGPYTIFEMKCDNGKIRQIFRLDYPHRVVHHAIMNVLEPIWKKTFTRDTYSCIKGRGIHGAHRKLVNDLKDITGTQYCLKLDIKKFYPSVDHQVLKLLVRKRLNDNRLLALLDEIIDSAPGLPIGNYLSQYLGNLYLAYFDHWVKEDLKAKYYYRYADDIVLLAATKTQLYEWLNKIRLYFGDKLKIELNTNYQVFPVAARGIDFVGYVFYHTHIRLRKSIKRRFARAAAKKRSLSSLCSYTGWAKHCNSKHLLKKLINESTIRNYAAGVRGGCSGQMVL